MMIVYVMVACAVKLLSLFAGWLLIRCWLMPWCQSPCTPPHPTPPLGCWTIDCACYDGLCHEVVVSLCSVQPSEVLDDFSCYDGMCHDVSHCSSQPSRWSMVVNAVWWHMPWSWCLIMSVSVLWCYVVAYIMKLLSLSLRFLLCGGMCHEVVVIIFAISVLWCYVVAYAMKLLLLSWQFLFCAAPEMLDPKAKAGEPCPFPVRRHLPRSPLAASTVQLYARNQEEQNHSCLSQAGGNHRYSHL